MHRTIKKQAALVAVTLLTLTPLTLATLGTPAQADEAQKRAQIRELIALNGAVQPVDELSTPMTEAMVDALRRSGVNVASGTGDTVHKATARVVRRRYDQLLEHVVNLYDRAFSEQEITDILAFSKTTAGQRYANAFPALLNRSLVLGQQWSQALQPELRQEVADAIRSQRASVR